MKENCGFVAYRLPHERHHHLCSISAISTRDSDINFSDFQFIFAPFDKSDNPAYLSKFSSKEIDGKIPNVNLKNGVLDGVSKEVYIETCQNLIDRITAEKVSKVILSRTQSIEDTDVDINAIFESMKFKYPDAFVYLLHHPDIGTWAAATPELLLSKNDHFVSTVALAGTRKYNPIDTEPWGNKEVEEHKYIETYVNESLDRLKLKYTKSETSTRRAGNVEHIESKYEITDTENQFIELIDKLHPGPAISGYPPKEAIDIIKNIESYDRKYYCGYLGPLDINDQSMLYVNLRCMEIFSNGYKIYIGGGITKDSIAEDEWNETILKSETMSDILSSVNYEDHK